jgi:hypothetical protein
LIEGSSICIKRLNPLIEKIFAFRIGTYACYFNFLIKITVSPIIMSINELPPGYPYITNIFRCEAIAPEESSIVINDNQKPFVLLAESAYKIFEEISMH